MPARAMKSASLAVLLAASAVAPAQAGGRPAKVVELFTSQGCSSCPPANANLAAISGGGDVLALSFGVTYWDYIGWKDTFAKTSFTDRQVAYEAPLGHRGPFTPQIVVNGRADLVGNRIAPLRALIAASGRPADPPLDLAGGKVAVGKGEAPAGGADVWLVRYDPRTVSVGVRKGENGGRTLPHSHVVRDLVRLGTWGGAALSLDVPHAAAGLKTAVLVQVRGGGPILSAIRD